MLVLSRVEGEPVIIDGTICIKIIDVRGDAGAETRLGVLVVL